MTSPKILVQYIRKPGGIIFNLFSDGLASYRRFRGEPIGCVVAICDTNNPRQIGVGYSLCNPKDKFSKKEARRIAIERAEAYSRGETNSYGPQIENAKLRQEVISNVIQMITRASEYFQQAYADEL